MESGGWPASCVPADGWRVGQSSLLPDMYFAWDSKLERAADEAVRRYYRDRYGLAERDLRSVRALVGTVRQADLRHVAARTVMIERVSPLDAATEAYLQQAIFQGTWGERAASLPIAGRLCRIDPRVRSLVP